MNDVTAPTPVEVPASIQIVGKPFAERTVLALGQAYESATGAHRAHPALGALGLE